MQKKIKAANSRLDRVKIIKRGNRLALRATLPPKPGDGTKNKQYIISPGFPASDIGVQLAVIKAQKIEADLFYDRPIWETDKDELIVGDAIAEFEVHYWQTREKTVNRVNNYKYDYLNHFLYLPQDEILSEKLLQNALLTSKPDTRKRRGMVTAYGALLNHFNISHDINKYKGNYQPKKKRLIPTEDQIDRYWEQNCKSKSWKWVYGIIVCYGIRPHEVFYLDCSKMDRYPPVLQVLEGTKTGARLVYPIPDAERVQRWDLARPILPRISTAGKSNMEKGRKISQKFNELNIPSPYHFRDAYAIRGEILNFNPATVAQWMGHDLETHYKRYLRHINKTHFDSAWLSRQQPSTFATNQH